MRVTLFQIPTFVTLKTRPIRIVPLVLCLAISALHSARAEQRNIAQLTAAAERGDAETQYRLGQAYVRGVGVRKDIVRAHGLFKQAAEQGHAEAIGGLGYFYANGFVVKQDLAEAAEWFRKGAEKGGTRAQVNYALALLHGRGVALNEAEGMQWIEKAAAHGQPHAFYVQGECFFNGTFGHPQDYGKARELFLKAAESDHAAAENMLGVIHQDGLGVAADLAVAESWFRKGAEQGDAKAQSNLGQLIGPDVEDEAKRIESLKWLLLAYNANEPMARNVLNVILRTRPPHVLKEAQRQAAEFKIRPAAEGKQDADAKPEARSSPRYCRVTAARPAPTDARLNAVSPNIF